MKTAFAVVNCYGYEIARYCFADMAKSVAERSDEDPGIRAWRPYSVVPVDRDAPRLQGAPVTERPLASHPLKSYRLRGPYGFIMIGATDDDDAMREAARSTREPLRENLERWDGSRYVPA